MARPPQRPAARPPGLPGVRTRLIFILGALLAVIATRTFTDNSWVIVASGPVVYAALWAGHALWFGRRS